MTKILADYVRESINEVEDIDIFQDSKEKQKFITKLADNSDFPRKSIETIFSRQLKETVKIEGKNENDFVKKQTKRFSSKLDLTPDTKKVEVGQEQSLDKSLEDKKSTPKLKLKTDTVREFTINDETYESFAVAVDSIITTAVSSMDEMTESEKKIIGSCLKIGFGETIETKANVRKLFAIIGIAGVYAKRIKKARKKVKENKAKEKLEDKNKPFENRQNAYSLQKPKQNPTKKAVDKYNKNDSGYLNGLQDDI